MRSFFLALVLSLAAPLGASVASAQDPPECRTVRPGLVVCTETQIFGRGPRAFYLLTRTRDTYELPELRRGDMARSVRRTVRHAPF